MKGPDRPHPNKTALRVGLVFLVIALVVGAFLAGWYGRYAAIDPRMRGFLWALDVTEKNYAGDLDEDALYEEMFGLLSPDPYSRHYTAAEYSEEEKASAGENEGYGFALSATGEEAVIALVVGNSPAMRAGLREGMHIYAWSSGGETKDVTSVDEFLEEVRKSSSCTFTAGYSPEETGEYSVSRKAYLASYCRYADSEGSFAFLSESGEPVLTEVTEREGVLAGADGKTAYLRLDEFSGSAAREVRECLLKMRERGRENLVLDLRSNGGGALDVLVPIAAHLSKNAPARNMLVTIARYKGGQTARFSASAGDYGAYFTSSSKVMVLADENTASASECLIGAMIDYGTIGYSGIVVREETGRTYGKGIMQSFFTNDGAGGDGGVMKLTVATVHWPVTGRCIQGEGVGVKDGAHAVDAPLIRGKEDAMLAYALGRLSSPL